MPLALGPQIETWIAGPSVEFWPADLGGFGCPATEPGTPTVVKFTDGKLGCLCLSPSRDGILFQSDSPIDDHSHTFQCQQVQGQTFISSPHVAFDKTYYLESQLVVSLHADSSQRTGTRARTQRTDQT